MRIRNGLIMIKYKHLWFFGPGKKAIIWFMTVRTAEKALKNIKRLKEPQYIKTWIIRILINNCNDICKRKKKNIEYNENIELNVKNVNEEVDAKLDFYILIKSLNEKEKI